MTKLFTTVFFLFFFFAGTSLAATTVNVSSNNAVRGPWLGFTAEWDAWDYSASTPSATDWTNIYATRVGWMRPGIVRVLMAVPMMLGSGGSYNFTSSKMTQLYRILDYCQANNIKVIINEWGNGWANPSGWVLGDANYNNAIGAYMDYFLNTKHYTVIKYFVLGNEPNYDPDNYPNGVSQWASAVSAVKAKFSSMGLSGFTIIGPDTSNADDWATAAARSYSSLLGGYDIHRYEGSGDVANGSFETNLKNSVWGTIQSSDTSNSGKPFFINEAGISDGMSTEANNNIGSYDYGIWMADYGVQAARAGTGSIDAWELDDNGHSGFTWGLWTSKSSGYALRPWFYTWSLLSRFVPTGSTIYAPANPSSSLRVMAAQTSSGAWTFIAVNRGTSSVILNFVAPGGSQQNFKYYVYGSSSQQKDSQGLPTPISTTAATPSSGVSQTVPANSVIVLTSVDSASPPPPTTLSADLNSDGKVNSVDAAVLMGAWGSTAKPKADINQDGAVNSVDVALMMGQWTS